MGRKYEGVREKSASSIEISFRYKGRRCYETIRLKPTPANLKKVSRHRSAVLDAIAIGTFDYAATFPDSRNAQKFSTEPGALITVSSWLTQCLERWRHELKASTFTTHKQIVNNVLIPEFGDYTLTQLSRSHVKQWVSKQTELSAKRLGNIVSPLRVALEDAAEDDLIEVNPLAGYRIRRKGRPRNDDAIDPFSIAERKAILAALSGADRNMVRFWFWTGLRPSELVALLWSDIDWVHERVRISRAHTQSASEPESTKTEAGERDIKLLPEAIDALKKQKAGTLLNPKGLVFLNPRIDGSWTVQVIHKTLWRSTLKRAGVRYRPPSQTRHSYASYLLMSGESPMWVAKQLGHTDWTFTAKVYSRWIPDDAPDAGGKAVARWDAAGSE